MTTTPSNSTPPFRIGDTVIIKEAKFRSPHRVMAVGTGGSVNIHDGFGLRWYGPGEVEHADAPKPTRLARARAALEVETKQHWHALQLLNAAIAEKEAAEKEAASVQARVEIPAPVLGVVREILGEPIANGPHVVRMIARHYGITEADLRRRLESEKT